jgi:transglutaminase-like putative cysteine protease
VNEYLESTKEIDWKHPEVFKLARELSGGVQDAKEVARRCFEWVRDEIKHSHDYKMNPVTCSASEVLQAGTGYCYAKSHLLAALLRANSIPAGLCYQRLSRDENGAPYTLHGLNAVYLPEGRWYRVDPRGNRPGIDAQFTPPVERLAFPIVMEGEADLPEIWAEPLPVIVQALRSYQTYDALWENLPDIALLPRPANT